MSKFEIKYLKEFLSNLKIIRNDLEYKYKIDEIIEMLSEFIKEKGKNQRTEDVLRQILKYCNYLHNDCKYRLNDGHIRKIRKIIIDYFGEEDKER